MLTQPIEASHIKDGAITVSHLSEEVTSYIKSLGVSAEELEEHKTEKAAHTGRNIAVENTFKNLTGTDLQMLLESVDYQITLANKAMQIATESIDSGDIDDGSIKEVDLDMNTFNGWDKNEADDLTSSTVFGGAINGVYSDLQLADNSVNTNNIVDGGVNTEDIADASVTAEKLAEGYLKKSGDTVEGDLTVEGDILLNGKPISSWPGFKKISKVKKSLLIYDEVGDTVDSDGNPACVEDSSDIWFCKVSVSCDSGEKLLSCTGQYDTACWGSDLVCSFQGTTASGSTCYAKAAVHEIDDSILEVQAICGETY